MTTDLVRSLNEFARNKHPGLVGVEIETCEPDLVTGRMVVGQEVVAGNNMVWAPVIITLADWLCAAGMSPNLPKGAGFTTIELKSNFLGTAAVGETVTGRATPVHKGKTTHVWDAVIRNETKDKTIALFRCTQMILHPRT
ncbi:MAG: PaaI family thioesterase [Alphaproteobacteria bacterium]|nr:PaaI family thioesterase [Alphaproteobacteria bacterium]